MLYPEHWHASSRNNLAVLELINLDNLLSFYKVRDVAEVVEASHVDSRASPECLPTGDQSYLDVGGTEWLVAVADVAADDWRVPFHVNVVLSKWLI